MSTGNQTPEAIEQDIAAIVSYARKELGLTGKLGIYGRSLGGVATSSMSNQVDMIIVDRSFASLNSIAKWTFFGPLSSLAFKIGTCGWQLQNDYNFLKKGNTKCYKVVTVDTKDDIVKV